MFASIFIGSYTTYLHQRSRAESLFRSEAAPVLGNKVQLLYNMLTLYWQNNPDENLVAEIVSDIEEIDRQIVAFRQMDYQRLLAHGDTLLSFADNFDEDSERHMIRLRIDMDDMAMRLRQSNYNQLAQEFNSTILSNYGRLPVFEGGR